MRLGFDHGIRAGLMLALVGCGTTAAVAPTPVHLDVSSRPAPRGRVLRVESVAAKTGLAAYAGDWRHAGDDQAETLAIRATGEFDWHIDRGGSVCEIAGTVELIPPEPPSEVPAFRWSMTTNTCNNSYQGRTSADWIVQHDATHLALVDAEFHSEPVPYDLNNGTDGLQDTAVPAPDERLPATDIGEPLRRESAGP